MTETMFLSKKEARDFTKLSLHTQHLALTVLGQNPPDIDINIRYLGRNLARAEAARDAAGCLVNEKPLALTWQEYLALVYEQCLKPYNEEKWIHLQRVAALIRATRRMMKKIKIQELPDWGYKGFQNVKQQFQLTDEHWDILELAAGFHDLGTMAYPDRWWENDTEYTEDQRVAFREQLEAHARTFFYLGEFFNVHPWVTGLSVMHHYPCHRYPKNGVVKFFEPMKEDPIFQLLYRMLPTFDVFEAFTSPHRRYRNPLEFGPAIIATESELQSSGTEFLPFIMALKRNNCEALVNPN